ncbi:MAG: hypothetical protein WBF93_21675 [Pirellulales bacterium]
MARANPKHRTVVILAVLLAVGSLSSTQAEDDDQGTKDISEAKVLMRAKLASSQVILEGLVTKDRRLVERGANELKKISDAAAFHKYNDPVYKHYSREFRRLVEKVGRLASDNNLEAASFTYMHATTTCINCHDYVRDVIRIADQEEIKQKPKVRLLQAD